MTFLVLRDRTGLVQVTFFKKDASPSLRKTLTDLTPESFVTVTGKVNVSTQVKMNGVELILQTISVEGVSLPELPISDTSQQNDLLNWRFLSLRRKENLLIFQVQTTIEHAMRKFWEKHEFIEIHSPKLMGTASESGAELFELPYFGKTAYLAQSPQFYKQMAIAAGFEKVFEIGPVFRANSSHTNRHDTEFTSVDVEIGGINSHEDIMRFEEEWLAFVINAVKEKHDEDIFEHYGVRIRVPETPFPRLTLKDARDILQRLGHVIEHKEDLDPEGERMIGKYIKEKYEHDFVFITDYPADIRAFYHMRHKNNSDLTMGFDLLGKGIEITTGAQREHRPNVLEQQALERGYDLSPLQDYIGFFKYGCPPHGGFGFGLTRLIMVLLELDNVRQATYIYRGPTRLTP